MLKRMGMVFWAVFSFAGWADGPADNVPEKVRQLPPKGVDVPPDKKAKLEAGLAELKGAIDSIRGLEVKDLKNAKLRDLLPDVDIFYRAVHDGLVYNEFLQPKEVDDAFVLLDLGKKRAAELAEGKHSWTTQTGLVVRGFVSKLDGSVQPYGLWIPESYDFSGSTKYRLDIWFHGRVEVFTEGNFLRLRMNRYDQIEHYAPKDTIVTYPYARYCNASKFAGEVDSLEVLAETQRRYRIDDERISVRGFSMGGAATWHFAVHYAERWFAANPGAGFSETPRFLDFFQGEKLNPQPWEKKLWAMYDCDKVSGNLLQCPTVAYSGATDKQLQAAEVMAAALKERGVEMTHFIAPNTGHKVIPELARPAEARMQTLARTGRQRVPSQVLFETYTLKYNSMTWVTVDGLKEHWAPAKVSAKLLSGEQPGVSATVENVTDITFAMAAGDCPFDLRERLTVRIGNQTLTDVPRAMSDRSWCASFHLDGETWKVGVRAGDGLRKRHDLQGPIDDALMDAFVFVRPTGTAANELAEKWTKSELTRAIEHWRRHFRGYAQVKDDTAITDEDIATKNLILWGDASSNAVIKKISEKLPVKWDSKTVTVGAKSWDAAQHALICVYPNPLNPKKYVVLNSSFTFREYAYLNNARQVPMLPDWAVADLREAPGTVWPGKIVAADFFDEGWRVKE